MNVARFDLGPETYSTEELHMPRTSSGIASDPEYRTARARKAARARHSTDAYIRTLVKRDDDDRPTCGRSIDRGATRQYLEERPIALRKVLRIETE